MSFFNCSDKLLTQVNTSLFVSVFTEHALYLAVCNESWIGCVTHLAVAWESEILLPWWASLEKMISQENGLNIFFLICFSYSFRPFNNNNNKTSRQTITTAKFHICFLVVASPVWCFLEDLMLIVELVCVRVCKEGESSLEWKMFIYSHSSTSASHSFLPSLLYCSHGVAGNNFFGFPSDPMQSRRQEHVGRME